MTCVLSPLAALVLALSCALAWMPAYAYMLYDDLRYEAGQSLENNEWRGNRFFLNENFRVKKVTLNVAMSHGYPQLLMRVCQGEQDAPGTHCANFTPDYPGAGYPIFTGRLDAQANSYLWVMVGVAPGAQGYNVIADNRQYANGIRSSDGGATWSTGHTNIGMRVEVEVAYPPAGGALQPPTGPTAGGTQVVITGRNLYYIDAVQFGGVTASFTRRNNAQLIATAPPGMGSVPVTAQGTYGAIDAGSYTYADHPAFALSGIDPGIGPADGGTTVVLTGNHFHGVAGVSVRGNPAAFTPDPQDGTRLQVQLPGTRAGSAMVTVETAYGTDSVPYLFQEAPTVAGVQPAYGLGGTPVRISGSDLANVKAVHFGSQPAASFAMVSDPLAGTPIIQATAPPSPFAVGEQGIVPITVETAGGTTTMADAFEYLGAPQVLRAAPGFMPLSGGSVTLSGQHLKTATQVWFGTAPAIAFQAASDDEITAVAPALPPGGVAVQVTTQAGDATLNNALRYVGAPTLGAISPAQALATGGTQVSLTGTGLASATAVTFGGVPATALTVESDTRITATAPAHAAGPVAVAVTTAGGTVTRSDLLAYVARTDGACGSAQGQPRIATPTAGLCSAGQASSVDAANGAWAWSCAGTHGGNTSQCSAPWADAGSGQAAVQVPGWRIDRAAFTPGLPAPLPEGARTDFTPLALTLTGSTPSARVTVNYTQPVPPGAVYLKYGPSPDGLGCSGTAACAQPHWYALPGAQFAPDGLGVTFTLTDGGAGDSDAVPGQITDPGLPVLLAAAPADGAHAIPTLSAWALALLVAALTLLAARRKHFFR